MTNLSASSRKKGFDAETIAAAYLRKEKFKILERNYSAKTNFQGGEIDIIAMKDDTIHFVEVKFRSSTTFGFGRESVTLKKQDFIRRTAMLYLVKKGILDKFTCQFDVIEVTIAGGTQAIELFENCF